jgi:hypothetical protein
VVLGLTCHYTARVFSLACQHSSSFGSLHYRLFGCAASWQKHGDCCPGTGCNKMFSTDTGWLRNRSPVVHGSPSGGADGVVQSALTQQAAANWPGCTNLELWFATPTWCYCTALWIFIHFVNLVTNCNSSVTGLSPCLHPSGSAVPEVRLQDITLVHAISTSTVQLCMHRPHNHLCDF